MRELKILAEKENLDKVTSFIDEMLVSASINMEVRTGLQIAAEEIFINIASYAYGEQAGEVLIRLELSDGPGSLIMTFIDHGIPYDPLKEEEPDITKNAEERKIGGLGIFLVRRLMDKADYQYKNGCNILTVQKIL